jgi:hypothetical protein
MDPRFRRPSLRPAAAALLAALALGILGSAPADAQVRLATLPLGTTAHELVLVGDLAYVATGKGLAIIDVANPSAPFVRGSVAIGGKALGIAIRGSYALLASPGRDLVIVDISNPALPAVAAARSLASSTWNVAVKDHVAYVASYGGEIYLYNVTDPAAPVQIRVLGVPTWSAAGQDAAGMTKLRSGVATGNAKVTDVSIAGHLLLATDWNYGRVYAWDVSNAASPVFRGSHAANFTLRVEGDPTHGVVYALGAYGSSSGVYSVPTSLFNPGTATRHATCSRCDFEASTVTDYGGLAIAEGGRHVVTLAGKIGSLDVLDVSRPNSMVKVSTLPLGKFNVKTGDTLGVKTRGDFIFAATGLLGFQVFLYPGLAD